MRPILAVLISILLYNAHAVLPSNVQRNEVVDGIQYCEIDMREGVVDPRNFQRFCINVAFAQAFLLTLWDRKRSLGVTAAIWFGIQAAEVYLTGNLFTADWPDWITLAILGAAWVLWEKWTPVKEAILKIVHVR